MTLSRYIAIILLACVPAICSTEAAAADSRLAQGKWVKVKVDTEGIQQITHEQLRNWGFKNPEDVAVYGYGGTALALDRIGAAPDDLQPTPTLHTPDGRMLFYGDATLRFDLRSLSEYDMPSDEQQTLWRHNIYDTGGYYFLSDNPVEATFTTVAAPEAPEAQNYVGHFHVDARDVDAISPLRMGSFFIECEFSAAEPYEIPVTIVDQVESELDMGGLSRKPQLTFTYCAHRPDDSEGPVRGPEARATGEIARLVTYTRTADITPSSEAEWPYALGFMQLKTAPAAGRPAASGSVILTPRDSRGMGFDRYSIIYARLNRLPAGEAQLVMQYHNTRAGRPIIIADATPDLQLWDVSNPAAVALMELSMQPDGTAIASMPASFNASNPGRLILFSTTATHHSPAFAEEVACQNVHATEVPHMAIITTDALEPYALRLAQAHERIDGIKVGVYRSRELYNEFSCGAASPSAYRRFAAMLHERDASRFGYLLLLGPSHWDHRGLYGMPAAERLAVYESRSPQLNAAEPTAYATDAFAGALSDDYDYISMHRAPLTVAVGRIPASTPAKAAAAVDRTISYMENPPSASSYFHAVMASASGDGYEHYNFGEHTSAVLDSCNSDMIVHRLPLIAYPLNGERNDEANRRLRANLTQGRGLFTFFGHSIGGNYLGEGFYSTHEVERHPYNTPPVAFLGTCEAFGIDLDLNTLAPAMLTQRSGGAIAIVAASRKVYGSENHALGVAFVEEYAHATPGTTVGTLFMNAHNKMMQLNDGTAKRSTNTKCYNLAGDPAVRLPIASAAMKLLAINGSHPAEAAPVAGCATLSLEGAVVDAGGDTDTDFSGTVEIRIYDTPRAGTVMNSEPTDGEQPRITLEYDLLATATATAEAGRWQASLFLPAPSVPGEAITIEAHATHSDSSRQAHLTLRGIPTSETIASAPADDTPPAIEEVYIDTPGLSNGRVVAPSFVLYAAIAVPPAGLGVSDAPFAAASRVVLDGTAATPVEGFITPKAGSDGKRMLLTMPFAGLDGGRHTIDIELFSNTGAAATATLDFIVAATSASASLAVEEYPARTAATFTIDHNLDGADATIIIRDATGATMRTLEGTTRWDLLDARGCPVPHGVYTASALLRSGLRSCHTAPVPVVVVQ